MHLSILGSFHIGIRILALSAFWGQQLNISDCPLNFCSGFSEEVFLFFSLIYVPKELIYSIEQTNSTENICTTKGWYNQGSPSMCSEFRISLLSKKSSSVRDIFYTMALERICGIELTTISPVQSPSDLLLQLNCPA